MIDFIKQVIARGTRSITWRLVQGVLFWKYVVLFAGVMGLALVANSVIDMWVRLREHRVALIHLQKEQAEAAAAEITQFIREIESQLGWTTYLPWTVPATEQRELDGLRLLRQVPAIAELTLVDGAGREQLRLSRQSMDRIGTRVDLSDTEWFKAAVANKIYHGPVYFRRGTEPFMTLAMSGARRESGVSVAEVNLTYIWDVINQIHVGRSGRAYVVDAQGRLIAHPDISLVLRNTDLSQLEQVRSARREGTLVDFETAHMATNEYGERVLTAYATAAPLNWLVFVELPEHEANEPLYAATIRSVAILLVALVLALLAGLLLARRMVIPIRELTAGAARIGAGALDHRIRIKTGDELEDLGEQLNDMANQLQRSYVTLERKVAERTQQLQAANLSKSRFLAAASHDLRQPLHALNLFVAQLHSEPEQAERDRLAHQIEVAVANMNDLFGALLDISRLDAGAQSVSVSSFPVYSVLRRIETTFATAAHVKGLRFRVVRSSAWVRSDAILLERILLNLVSNAVRYTASGGIVVGCRHSGDTLRIDVIDSGIGIAQDQQRNVFSEFYQVAGSNGVGGDGLGLGLAIVERLCVLLGHSVSVRSTVGRGSQFSVSVPMVRTPAAAPEPSALIPTRLDRVRGSRVVVLDDDTAILAGMGGLLKGWGCRVVTASSGRDAVASLDGDRPDLIISDFHLKDGQTGIEAVAAICHAFGPSIPAFLISGDTSPDRLREAQARGYHLLHKPVSPMTLRAMMSRLLQIAPGQIVG